MQNFNINDLPKLVRSKTITSKQASDFLWKEIYQKPKLFGLGMLSEDQKSDLLLAYHEKFEHLFYIHDENKQKFFYYLKRYLELIKTTWLRKVQLQYDHDQLNIDYIKFYDDSKYQDSHEDFVLDKNYKKNISQKFNISKTSYEIKKLKIAQITALILFLKSCHSVTDELIEHVSRFTKIPIEKLSKMIEKMKLLTSERTSRRDKLIARRNNAFYFHRKYTLSLKNSIPGSHSYLFFLQRYIVKTKSWKYQNKLLNNHFKNSPTNKAIAEELGVNSRKIAYYISQALKEKSTFKNEVLKFIKEDEDLYRYAQLTKTKKNDKVEV